MHTSPTAPVPWKYIAHTLWRFAPLWLGSAILMSVVGGGYSLQRTRHWRASQPLLVRDEANGAVDRLGRFASQTDMQAAQETILEMARNPEVVAAALQRVGPPPGEKAAGWPTERAVEDHITDLITVRPPKGAEFGTTEVIYLETEAIGRERAERLCSAVFQELSERMQMLRKVRADSVLRELTDARRLAFDKLNEATARLQAMESAVGGDLAELRSMTETISSDGSARRNLVDVETQLQSAELELQALLELKELLVAGAADPAHLLVAGGDLLASQPTLKRLKDGLIDAQLAVSQLNGRFSAVHPKLRAAQVAEQEIRQRLQQESAAAILAMEPALAVARERISRLREKQAELGRRLEMLANIRADYAALVSEVRQRTEVLGNAERALAEAEANHTAALSTSLVSKLDPPKTGDRPEGPGGLLLCAAATSSGLIFGLGLVFLVAPAPAGPSYGRRWSDYVGGRRRSDAPTPAAEPLAVSPPAATTASDLAAAGGMSPRAPAASEGTSAKPAAAPPQPETASPPDRTGRTQNAPMTPQPLEKEPREKTAADASSAAQQSRPLRASDPRRVSSEQPAAESSRPERRTKPRRDPSSLFDPHPTE